MNFDTDDPRLTTYALGELEGDDLTAIEGLLTENPEARRFIEETRRLAGLLSDSLRSEPAAGLDPARREAIAAQLQNAVVPNSSRRIPWRSIGLAAAASVAIGGGTLAFWIGRSAPDRSAPASETALLAHASKHSQERAPAYGESPGKTRTPFRTHGGLSPSGAETEYDREESENLFLAQTEPGVQATPLPEPAAQPGQQAQAGRALSPKDVMRSMDKHNTFLPTGDAKFGTQDYAIDSNSMKKYVEQASRGQGQQPQGGSNNQGQQQAGQPQVRLSVENHGQKAKRPAESAQNLGQTGSSKSGMGGMGGGMMGGRGGMGMGDFRRNVARAAPASGPAPALGLAEAAPHEEDRRGRLTERESGLERNGILRQQVQNAQNQIRPAVEPPNTEKYAPLVENDFEPVSANHTLSTFSIDVDTASYANVRRFLNQSMLPPPDAVRIEELINYFSYHYPSPDGDVPFSVNTEVTRCPWNPDHQIVRIGLKGQEVRFEDRKPTNLVFVVDVSGSMTPANKLPLVKAGLRMLAEQLTEKDRVAIVVYAGQVGLALPSTGGNRKQTIVRAIDALRANGSTNGAGGIELAYDVAVEHFLENGINRVILATDGDFNVGTSDAGSLARIAEQKAKTGVFLSVLGVGGGNLNDQLMESIADKGNGNYAYLDNLDEARKVLVEQVGGTLMTIAKDVKIQVDFNPAQVGAYRLIGYENRKLANRDFRDDTKDAGEIGSGHTVTALYELIPPGAEADKLAQAPEPSKYVKPGKVDENARELLTVRLRYKQPDGQTSQEIDQPVFAEVTDLGRASSDTRFAAAVAEFGLLLRNSKYRGQASYGAVLELAKANLDDDPSGRRHEFVELVEKARTLPAR